MNPLKRYTDKLTGQTSIAPLATFRILFGAVMVFSIVRFMALGWIEDHYVKPLLHFKYFGFEWVTALPGIWMYVIHVVMLIAAACVMIGFLYRVAVILLFVFFTYTELIDLTYYLNHYYFVSIVCLFLILVPANRHVSVDTWRNSSLKRTTIPFWCIFIFQLQLAIVYTYAGLAKINEDWLLNALPMKIWMPANDTLPVLGSLLSVPAMAYVFSWLGMLYDCTIVIWLSYRKTRLIAYVSVVFFHIVTGLMFQIGVFPLVMVSATLLFFPPQWHVKFLSFFKGFKDRSNQTLQEPAFTYSRQTNRMVAFTLVFFFTFQLLFPWRYLAYSGNVFLTEEGYRFSWRVMLMEKAGTATFYVKDSVTGREGVVVNSQFLNTHQEKQMAMQPDMILQFARFLKQWYAERGVHDPIVRAEVYVTLNGRPSQLLFDAHTDLSLLNDGWKPKTYLISEIQ